MPLFGAPGERIGYELYSHPDGAPPLVLIHGFTASKASFEANLAGLREHFTVVSVELLGHGDSDAPADPVFYRPERAVRRILQLLDHLGYQRALFCGHSLGGALALRLALDAPEWVAGLVVINSSSAAGDPAWREAARPSMQQLAARVRAEGTGFMKQTRLYPAHSRRLDPHSRELLTRDFDRLTPEGVAGTADALVVDVNAWERHPTLAVPFLLVVGGRDADFAPNAETFLSRFPPDLSRQVGLADAGHAANIEQPRQFEEALVGFAREIGYLRAPAARNNMVLTALGGVLVFAGLGLLAAALFFNDGDDGDDGDIIAAAPESTAAVATPTPVTQVAGTAISGQPTRPSVVGIATAAPSPAASPTSAPANTPTTAPPPAATPAPTREPQPTAAPEPTATPTVPPSPTATATATGPFVRLSGPGSAAVGEAVTVYAQTGGGTPLRTDITLPNGQTLTHTGGASFTAASPGCYAFAVTAYFADGKTLSAAHAVSVGGVSCGAGQG